MYVNVVLEKLQLNINYIIMMDKEKSNTMHYQNVFAVAVVEES